MINSDTAKEDIGLVVIGGISLLLFVMMYLNYHPLSKADNSYGEMAAIDTSTEILKSLGYSSDLPPNTTYRVNSSLLDSLQSQTNFTEYYSGSDIRDEYPAFYWRSVFNIDQFQRPGPMGLEELQPRNIVVEISERGEMIALHNEHNLLPVSTLNIEALEYATHAEDLGTLQFPDDDTIYQLLQFQFVGANADTSDTLQINPESTNYFNRNVAERLAGYYLDKTSWNWQNFEVAEIEKVLFGDAEGARVVLDNSAQSPLIATELQVIVLPTGTLGLLDYEFSYRANNTLTIAQIIPGVRIILLLLGVFYLIVLLFMRFRQRQIDIKAAILVAVLAGLIIPLTVISSSIYGYFQEFGQVTFSLVVGSLIGFGVIAAFSSFGFFMLTAVSDSVTRENWPEKIKTVDFLRSGYFLNQPFGLSLLRGILFGVILLAVWAVTITYLPSSYYSLESTFLGDRFYVSNVAVIFSKLALFLLVCQALYMILITQLKKTLKSPVLLVLVSGIAFALFNPLQFEVGPLSTEIIATAIIGLGAGIIYIKEDVITVLVSISTFMFLEISSAGWLLSDSPDSTLFYSVVLLIVVGFIYSGYSVLYGRETRDMPLFVPDYVDELAHEQRIRQELQIARKVQQSFLPNRTPDIPGLDIAAICKPAYETGGDYYDFITLEDGRLAVTVGDVSGKGIQAAFYMTFIKGVLHALCNEFVSSISILQKTNKMFRKNAERGTFISLIFGIVDHDKNSFCFSRAGHNPLLYFDSKKGKLYEYQPDGIAVGMADDDIFCNYISEQTIELQKDDLIILYTDGVVEATSKTDKLYGDKRLHSLIRKYNKLPSEELISKVYQDLKAFSGSVSQHDDLTMLIIKKK